MSAWFHNIQDMLPHIPGFILAFFIVFIVHEFGHYGMARLFKMKVDTFSIGIGRKLGAWKDKRGTLWTFHLFPVGGYVTIADLNITDEEEGNGIIRRPLFQRILVVLAGPLSNLILPFILFILCFSVIGYPYHPPYITGVEEGLPAQEAGILPGDKIVAVNGNSILSYDDLADYIEGSHGKTLSVQVLRGDDVETIDVTPDFTRYTEITGIERKNYKIGVLNALNPIPFKFIHEVEGVSTKDNIPLARDLIREHLDQKIRIGMYSSDDDVHYYTLSIPSELNAHLDDPAHRYYDSLYFGPVTTNAFAQLPFVETAVRAVEYGAELMGHVISIPAQLFPADPQLFSHRVHFSGENYVAENIIYRLFHTMALLSLFIGFINLIPFPRLDGDYLLYYTMEGVLKRRPTRKQRAWAIMIAIFALYSLVLFANLQDVPGYLKMKTEDISEWFE